MKLLFERFLSEERNEVPDIDIDFAHQDREKVIQYVYNRYGREHAAMTAEVITYRTRSAIRDVGKALGLSLAQVDAVSKEYDARESLAGAIGVHDDSAADHPTRLVPGSITRRRDYDAASNMYISRALADDQPAASPGGRLYAPGFEHADETSRRPHLASDMAEAGGAATFSERSSDEERSHGWRERRAEQQQNPQEADFVAVREGNVAAPPASLGRKSASRLSRLSGEAY
jgi:Bacterial DNA polymerase III alpha NTPase domain